MSWGDVLGMCVVVLSAALMARESHKRGWAEGHGDGWRGAMEQNTNVNSGLRAELAAAHEATDDVRKKLKDTQEKLELTGRSLEASEAAWREAKKEFSCATVTAVSERDRRRRAEEQLLGESRDYATKLADFQKRVAQAEQQIRIERKHREEEVAQRQAVHEMEMQQANGRRLFEVNAAEREMEASMAKLADDVEKVLFTRGRGITHEWRRKKLLALCADVRKRWSKP